MKVSVNSVQGLVDFDLPPVPELVRRIGSQLGEIESVADLGARYQKIVIVKVAGCARLENSDHLNICQIDDGGSNREVERLDNGLVQVLTGAPNVHKGMLAVWIPPGATVPESFDRDSFVLTSREMRGSMSHGMLASPRELGLGEYHEGLLELTERDLVAQGANSEGISLDELVGRPFAEAFGLDDTIIDIENKMFTHRPDCFGALGVAREIAGILGHKFKSPDWYLLDSVDIPPTAEQTLELTAENQVEKLVPRFMVVPMSGVEVKPSPVWLQVALAEIGQKPINNVVDLTNFYMQLTGQPLHAYDYDKLRGHAIGVRTARQGEKAELLNGKTYELDESDIVIVDNDRVIGLGGVMGGQDSEVTSGTKNIVVECANFDMYSVRRTSMRHGLFTDAVTRFTKGQSPLQNRVVLAKIVEDLGKVSGAKVAGHTADEHGELTSPEPLTVSAGFINSRLGTKLEPPEIAKLLENVEFDAHPEDGDNVCVLAPFWRTDIELPEDIVEEVGRLHGYDKLPLELPKRSIKPASKNDLLELKAGIRTSLAEAGANEVLTYSFVHGNLLDKVGQDKSHAFQLSNALSPDLQYYRLSLIPSLLEKVHGNIKAGYNEFALFELGKAHIASEKDDDGLPREDDLTALVVAANKTKESGAAYYQAKKFLENLIKAPLTYQTVPESMQKFDITKPFEMNRTALVYAGDKFLGIIGEFRIGVIKSLKLPQYCAGFELDTLALAKFINDNNDYIALPKYPKVEQDITLKIASDTSYQSLAELLTTSLDKLKPSETLAALMPLNIYQKEDDKSHKQVSFRLEIASYEKTLVAGEVNDLLDKLADTAKKKFQATRV